MKIFKNLENFDLDDPKKRKQLTQALQFFLALPNRDIPDIYQGDNPVSLEFRKQHSEMQKAYAQKANVRLQEFSTTGDFPASILPVIEKFHAVPDYDNGFEQIFDIRDYTGSKRNGFDILDVESGLTFEQIIPGQKLLVYQMSGTKTRCYFSFYGGALGWHRQLFDDEEYWTIEDNAIEFRNVAYQYRASVFYALIEALRASKGCCSWMPYGSVPTTNPLYTALGDAQTINYMAQTIMLAVRNKGYGINPATTGFIVLTPLQLRGRIRRALSVMLQAVQGSARFIDFNFTQITTMMLTNSDTFYVILPKKKLKGGYRMDLTLFSDFDILSYTDTQAGWMRYGGCIADTDQIQCATVDLASGSCP